MRVVKKLNNNAVVCVDNNNQELIAIGRGIGFPKTPYILDDLNLISKTFYQLDFSQYGLFSEIPIEIFETSSKIVEKAKNMLNTKLNPNLITNLADHIYFAIKRLEKFKSLQLVFSYEIEQFYPKETELGKIALEIIANDLGYYFPKSEITAIAMHFVNAQEEHNQVLFKNDINEENIINEIINRIENFYGCSIDKKSFSYNRLVSHIRYLLNRIINNKQFIDEDKLYDTFKNEHPKIYEVTKYVAHYIAQVTEYELSKNEQLYLMIHIHRILQNDLLTY